MVNGSACVGQAIIVFTMTVPSGLHSRPPHVRKHRTMETELFFTEANSSKRCPEVRDKAQDKPLEREYCNRLGL